MARFIVDTVLAGKSVQLKAKEMPNGELRRQVQFEGIPAHITFTEADQGGWQESHLHKGLTEVYTIVAGGARFVVRSSGVVDLAQGMTITIKPGDSHNVALARGAVMSTLVFGEPVGNPDKKGNDWWPADEEFDRWMKEVISAA